MNREMNKGTLGDTEVLATSQFYHGTRVELKPGDLIVPGRFPNIDGLNRSSAYVYLTANLDEAIWEAEIALGNGSARVYTVRPAGEIGNVLDLPDHKVPGHPFMSCYSDEPLTVTGEVTHWLFYHGTRADLKPGDLIEPGYPANFGSGIRKANHVYLARTLDAAIWGAELAKGELPGRIYIVEPTGPIENDPNLTDKKFRGNPTQSFRSREPLRITAEAMDWQGHPPESIKARMNNIARLERLGLAQIDD